MLVSRRGILRSIGITATASAVLPFARAADFHVAGSASQDGYIHLERNENVFGPSRKALEAVRSALVAANYYPPGCDDLKDQIASCHHVMPGQVLLGCGSSEILRVAAAAFLGKQKRLLQATPTFDGMERYARITGAEVISVRLTEDFAHDLDAMRARVDSSVGLVYICNPNNPTASMTPREHLERFISTLPQGCYVLIDEAYHHYAGPTPYLSFIDYPITSDRLIVTRTFSQAFGLAGLRLGYCVAPGAVIEQMRPHLVVDSVNSLAICAASAALSDTASLQDFVRRNADARQEFLNQAVARTLRPIDCHTNFVMMDTHHPVKVIIDHFRRHNILIGPYFPSMNTYIRVSLGTSDSMMPFWSAWDELPYPRTHH